MSAWTPEEATQLIKDLQKFFADRGIYNWQVNIVSRDVFLNFIQLAGLPREKAGNLQILHEVAMALGKNMLLQEHFEKEDEQVSKQN